jgi:hypothetical protein
MATNGREPTDLMILRAWIEPGHERCLRVRIIRVGKGHAPPIASAAATPDDVCAAVRLWLEELLAR